MGEYIEDFWEMFRDELKWAFEAWRKPEELITRFSDESGQVPPYVIQYTRFLTAANMQENVDDYRPYMANQTVDQYIASQVNPPNHEADNLPVPSIVSLS
eukprot:TRINITY_DN16871_c0_g1_i1.p1 TRINITY_DN16871_c0_g1~~TRINITY_DN16871_c0_g1_i1.p1  ORF type:complete len:100 (+),score=11.36 TRINITY_DN16871_c0_g1_i1:357-656(+)